MATGTVRGITAALLQYLAFYRPGSGRTTVDPSMQCTLPILDWHRFAYVTVVAGVTLTASQSTAEVIHTVPADERQYLQHVRALRASGDNNFVRFAIDTPQGYGNASADLISAPARTDLWWPDNANIQAATQVIGLSAESLLLEPGTTISLVPDGSGVSASTFSTTVLALRTYLVRALAP